MPNTLTQSYVQESSWKPDLFKGKVVLSLEEQVQFVVFKQKLWFYWVPMQQLLVEMLKN